MSTPLIVVVTLIYLITGIDQLIRGHPGYGIVFLGYAAANVGMIWAMLDTP